MTSSCTTPPPSTTHLASASNQSSSSSVTSHVNMMSISGDAQPPKIGEKRKTSMAYTPAFDYDPSKHVKIGDYVIFNTLGKGSFGKVKLGRCLRTGRKVALKILNRKKLVRLDVVQKTKREISLLGRLEHKHVIRLYTVICTPTDIFMVMEFISGGELFDYVVKKGKLTDSEGRRFFQQIISGIKYCHDHSIVHRDLKPENLLLDHDCNVKIADFGLSNLMPDGNLLDTSCGSPNYAAPEVVSGRQYAGPEVDVWSCGIILYALLTCRLPFDSDHVPTLFKKIEAGVFYMQPYLSQGAQDLISKMLIVDPLKRISIKDIICHPWFMLELPTQMFADHRITSAYKDMHVDVIAVQRFAEERHITFDDVMISLMRGTMGELYGADGTTLIRRSEADDDKPNDTTPRMCLPAGSKYCSANCNMCPKWGADSCLFARRIHSLDQCDLCPRYGDKGCIFSTKRISIEDFGKHMEGLKAAAAGENRASFNVGTTRHLSDSGAEAIINIMAAKNRPKQRWHLGIRSASSPQQIMQSLFDALLVRNFEWSIISPYQCHIRRRFDPSVPLTAEELRARTVVQLSLYTLKQNHFLLDFLDMPDKTGDTICRSRQCSSRQCCSQGTHRSSGTEPPEIDSTQQRISLETNTSSSSMGASSLSSVGVMETSFCHTATSPPSTVEGAGSTTGTFIMGDDDDMEVDEGLLTSTGIPPPPPSVTLRYLNDCATIIHSIMMPPKKSPT